MPRRQRVAAARSGSTAAHRLSACNLDELLTRAEVAKNRRAACVDEINQQLDFYNRRLARKNAPTEASQAESLRLVANAARELFKALGSLPPGLRLIVEPDYSAYVRKVFALHVARALDAQWPADLLSRARAPLPLELILAALIDATDKAGAAMEKQVSRTWSKRRGILARNELAFNLKGIAVGHSPKLANNQRAAEDWAALILDAAGIRCPIRETNSAAFAAMFTLAIR
jgi:hypothetical protein